MNKKTKTKKDKNKNENKGKIEGETCSTQDALVCVCVCVCVCGSAIDTSCHPEIDCGHQKNSGWNSGRTRRTSRQSFN